MEETTTVVPPPVPPKLKPRSPLQESSTATVPARSVAPSVTLVDVYHNSGSSAADSKNHVVKILINPENESTKVVNGSDSELASDKQSDGVVICDVSPCIRISLNSDMIQKNTGSDKSADMSAGNYFYYGPPFNYGVISSGQVSPSDTLDSGTCSDLDGTPPPPSKKKNGVSVTMIGQHKRAPSSSSGAEVDSDDNESSISCDSLTSGKTSPVNSSDPSSKSLLLPQTLLQDIRQRNTKLVPKVDEKTYEDRKREEGEDKNDKYIDPDMFYNFHIHENVDDSLVSMKSVVENEHTFAGYKDLLGDGADTIRSAKGTVRGVKNRVRAGIATFLQINNSTMKSYKEKEIGKVVVYTTTMGILRDTYQACMKVKQILRTLLVKFEERDVFMSSEYQAEIKERMRCEQVLVPQVFLEGVHIGDAETVERLNESGELRRIMKPFKSMDVCTTCQVCGGFRLLPCQICKGSKKSVHRNHFTAEFVALKCMNCDEVGLVRCRSCS